MIDLLDVFTKLAAARERGDLDSAFDAAWSEIQQRILGNRPLVCVDGED